MNDDCSASNEQTENWQRRFEHAVWLERVSAWDGFEKLMRQLANETNNVEEKARCLLWVAERGLHITSPNEFAARDLLQLADEVLALLGCDPNEYFTNGDPDRLIMRALFVRARALEVLGDYKECFSKGIEFMTAEDTAAAIDAARGFSSTLNWEAYEAKLDESFRDRWNCPRRHTGPWECSQDPECPRPEAEHQESYLRSQWSCRERHTPDECHEDDFCAGPDPHRRENWYDRKDCWDIIRGQ
jgi:hypothetical protein